MPHVTARISYAASLLIDTHLHIKLAGSYLYVPLRLVTKTTEMKSKQTLRIPVSPKICH